MFEKLFSGFASPRRLREAGILGMNRRNYNVIAKTTGAGFIRWWTIKYKPKCWPIKSASILRD